MAIDYAIALERSADGWIEISLNAPLRRSVSTSLRVGLKSTALAPSDRFPLAILAIVIPGSKNDADDARRNDPFAVVEIDEDAAAQRRFG